MVNKNYNNIHWLSDEDYAKAIGQLRLNMNGVFAPFTGYGLKEFIPSAVEQAIKLAEDFGLRVRGLDHEINLDKVRKQQIQKIGSH